MSDAERDLLLLVAQLIRVEMSPKSISIERCITLNSIYLTGDRREALNVLNLLIEKVGKDSECYTDDKPPQT